MADLVVRGPQIRLGQALKLASFAEDGGQAKEFIEAGIVTVNGDTETRRGRQLGEGDVVSLDLDGDRQSLTVRTEN